MKKIRGGLRVCKREVLPGITCNRPVTGGGNMHKLGFCPIPPNPDGNHRARKHAAARRVKRHKEQCLDKRGVPVSAGSKSALARAKAGKGKRS